MTFPIGTFLFVCVQLYEFLVAVNAFIKCLILLLSFQSALCLKDPSVLLDPLLLQLQNSPGCAPAIRAHLFTLPGDPEPAFRSRPPQIMLQRSSSPAPCGPTMQKRLHVPRTQGLLKLLIPVSLG